MLLPNNDRSRPAGNRAASDVIYDGDNPIVPTGEPVRCSCCGRVLRAERSVRLELGPVCHRLRLEQVAA